MTTAGDYVAQNTSRLQRLIDVGCNQDEITELLVMSDAESLVMFGKRPTRCTDKALALAPGAKPQAHLLGLVSLGERSTLWQCTDVAKLTQWISGHCGLQGAVHDVLSAAYALAALAHDGDEH